MSTGHENLSYNVLRMYIDNRRESPFMESRAAKIRRNRRIIQNIEFPVHFTYMSQINTETPEQISYCIASYCKSTSTPSTSVH